jgi:drug/metabolite transporter (DMT)-like permease
MQAYGFLVITTFCFGMNANFGKLAVGEISPMVMVLLRWVGTVLLMTVFFRKRLLREWPVLRRHWPYLAAMGVLGLTAFNALFYVAAHTTSALNMGILQGAIPMFVLLGAFVFFKAPMHPLQILGVVVTVVGVIVATVSGDLERLAALAFQPGDVLMIIACVLYASYSLLLRRCPAVDPLALFSVFAIGALVAALPLPIAEAAMGHLQWPTTKGWILVVLVVLFPSFLAQVFFIKGVSLIGPERAGVFFNLIPIFAAMVAVAFLGERFYAYHALALGLVLGGIGLSEWSKRREH